MSSLEFWSLVVTAIGVVVAAIGLIPQFKHVRHRKKEISDSSVDFSLLRFKEPTDKPVESIWSIRVLHPNKPIEKCSVSYDGSKLPWWDKLTDPDYEKFIDRMGGGNVRIPKELKNEKAMVIVKDGNKIIRQKRFDKLPIVNP